MKMPTKPALLKHDTHYSVCFIYNSKIFNILFPFAFFSFSFFSCSRTFSSSFFISSVCSSGFVCRNIVRMSLLLEGFRHCGHGFVESNPWSNQAKMQSLWKTWPHLMRLTSLSVSGFTYARQILHSIWWAASAMLYWNNGTKESHSEYEVTIEHTLGTMYPLFIVLGGHDSPIPREKYRCSIFLPLEVHCSRSVACSVTTEPVSGHTIETYIKVNQMCISVGVSYALLMQHKAYKQNNGNAINSKQLEKKSQWQAKYISFILFLVC